MNRESPVLKFDYRLRNDYCKPIIDYGKKFDYYTPIYINRIILEMLFPSNLLATKEGNLFMLQSWPC